VLGPFLIARTGLAKVRHNQRRLQLLINAETGQVESGAKNLSFIETVSMVGGPSLDPIDCGIAFLKTNSE
jgi:hypothetical protein